MRSVGSNSSVGSVSSVSSVISAGSISTFSITGDDSDHKHRSKFNKNKVNKKKRKTTSKRSRLKIRPGSQEELNRLVMTLKNASVDDEYVTTIVKTVRFLVHARRSSVARELFEVYCKMRSGVNDVQERRKALAVKEREGSGRKARREGRNFHEVDGGCKGRSMR